MCCKNDSDNNSDDDEDDNDKLDTSCELSAIQKINMIKYQTLFSLKTNLKNALCCFDWHLKG